ncbi:MAG: universal stress protein [Sulfurovum sp.]|nr:universal stress protein [Sulfurovum sp.]
MKYLIAIDFSESMKKIIESIKPCIHDENDQVILLHVAEPDPDFVGYEVDTEQMRDIEAGRYHKEKCDLEAIKEDFKKEGINSKALLIQGAIVETILKEAEKLAVDMIILGSHDKNFMQRALLGSSSTGIMHKSTLPVLIVPAHSDK